MNAPVLLCGLGRLGYNLVNTLRAAGLNVIVIDQKARTDDPRLVGVTVLRGDMRDRPLLEKAGVAQARGVLIATSDDLANIATALQIRSMNPHVRIVLRMFNQNLLARLGKMVDNVFALSVSALTAPPLALIALTGEALGGIAVGSERYQIAEVALGEEAFEPGRTVAGFAKAHDCGVVGLLRGDEAKILHDAPLNETLREGDRLVLIGEPDRIAMLSPRRLSGENELRWAGLPRRLGRIVLRAASSIDLPVKVCITVLLMVILVSTWIYHRGMGQSIPNGLYRTISVLSTGSELGGEELREGWHKVFVSVLRVLGVALMAATTAILTNYLLRVRGGALEVRRIPEGGHVVVCGLGNIGFRVTEELLRLGQPVVVIERDAAGKFVSTARRLGAAVIHGDATLSPVQKQANANSARALVAVTSDPLANLEIALLAREISPQQRIVVRMSDPALADALRDAANVKLAFSTTALAAPAFVAALFGDRVLNLVLIAGRMLAVVDFLVEEQDVGWFGQRIGDLPRERHALPVRLLRQGKKVIHPENERLTVGDQLMVIVDLADLRALLSQSATAILPPEGETSGSV